MRKLAVVLALASTALATPALARDNSWYVGADGGAMIVEDIHFDIGALKNAGIVDHHYGYDIDGNIGYDFGMFRVEAEVAYKSATVDGYRRRRRRRRFAQAVPWSMRRPVLSTMPVAVRRR